MIIPRWALMGDDFDAGFRLPIFGPMPSLVEIFLTRLTMPSPAPSILNTQAPAMQHAGSVHAQLLTRADDGKSVDSSGFAKASATTRPRMRRYGSQSCLQQGIGSSSAPRRPLRSHPPDQSHCRTRSTILSFPARHFKSSRLLFVMLPVSRRDEMPPPRFAIAAAANSRLCHRRGFISLAVDGCGHCWRDSRGDCLRRACC